MEEYTREQIQRADDTDLYVFLSGRGEQFKRCGKEYRWLRHDSVMINKSEDYSGGGKRFCQDGVIFTTGLSGQKARIKLLVLLEAGVDKCKLKELF